jgi:putative hemolysin
MKEIVDTLIYERAPWMKRRSTATSVAGAALRACLSYNDTLAQAYKLEPLSGREILDATGDAIAHRVSVIGLHNIPTSGPALIVANHPTGIADAIILHHALRSKRPDLYFFANSDVLRVFPQLGTHIAPVEWRKEKRSKSRTQATLQFTKQAMQDNRLGVIFPSGRLAKRTGLKLVERDWMTSAATIAKKYDVPIIPVHISARNSYMFYLFDIIHPTLRDITLFKETLNKKDFSFGVTIGKPIAPHLLPEDPKQATADLKSTVVSLGKSPQNMRDTSLKRHWKTLLQTVS